MKAIQFILSSSAAVVVLLLAYHFFFNASLDVKVNSLDGKVGEHGKELDRISRVAQEQSDRLIKHDGAIEVLDKRVVVLESEMSATAAKIAKSEGEVQSLREAAVNDQARIAKVEEDLTSLKAENARRAEELRSLKKEIDRQQEDVDRRLRFLEKKAGVEPPAP